MVCFLDHDKFCHALLQYRNTPSNKDGLSPAQKLYGSPTQDTFPVHRHSFSQEWQHKAEEIEQQAKTTQESTMHNLLQCTCSPPYRNWSRLQCCHPTSSNHAVGIYGIVTAISPNRRYYIKTSSGRVLVRNHRFLRRRVPLSVPVPLCNS